MPNSIKIYQKGNVFGVVGYTDWVPSVSSVKDCGDGVFKVTLCYEWTSNSNPSTTLETAVFYTDFPVVLGAVDDWYWVRTEQKVTEMIKKICNEAIISYNGFKRYESYVDKEDEI